MLGANAESLLILLELAPKGSLHDVLEATEVEMRVGDALKALQGIARGMAYLHGL